MVKSCGEFVSDVTGFSTLVTSFFLLSLSPSTLLGCWFTVCLYVCYFVSNIQRRLAAQNQERRKSKVRF